MPNLKRYDSTTFASLYETPLFSASPSPLRCGKLVLSQSTDSDPSVSDPWQSPVVGKSLWKMHGKELRENAPALKAAVQRGGAPPVDFKDPN